MALMKNQLNVNDVLVSELLRRSREPKIILGNLLSKFYFGDAILK
jgi:hypothetical protein